MTELFAGEIVTNRGIVHIDEIEQELKQCDSEPQRLAALAQYLYGSEETINMVIGIIVSLYQ